MRCLITRATGYVGSVLVPKLAAHEVTTLDICWFGGNPTIKADIRDGVDLSGFDAVIHLAAVANDPSGDLDPKLTWEVNALATMRLAEASVKAGVKQFIYAALEVSTESRMLRKSPRTHRLSRSVTITRPKR